MPNRIIFTCLLTIFLMAAQAQEKLNYGEVDKRSYQLFQEKNWKELVDFSSEAQKQGIDFFYLQVRTGVAWYNQGKYRNAAEYFLKAYKNDQSFDWLQEYVYYSLIFSGRKMEANKYAPLFSDSIKSKIKFKEAAITRLAYETGYSFNSGFDELKTRDFSTEVDLGDDYGEAYFLDNYTFHSVDLSHRLAPNLSINHNLTYIGVNREAYVDWGERTNSPIRINQFNYYLNPVWVIGKKLNISPSISLIFGNGDVYAGSLSGSTKTFSLTNVNYRDAVFSTALWSNFRNFSPGLEVNAGEINDSKFTQMSSWITWFPLSNSRLYLTPRVYFKSDSGLSNFGFNTFGLSGGFQLGQVHVLGQYLVGDMKNFVEMAGYLISNFPGKSDRKIMGSIYFPIAKKYQFVLRYSNQNVIENYQVYKNGIKDRSLEYNYFKNTLTAGISWNF